MVGTLRLLCQARASVLHMGNLFLALTDSESRAESLGPSKKSAIYFPRALQFADREEIFPSGICLCDKFHTLFRFCTSSLQCFHLEKKISRTLRKIQTQDFEDIVFIVRRVNPGAFEALNHGACLLD